MCHHLPNFPPSSKPAPISQSSYPTPVAEDSNQLHQVDFVGPIYLKGQRQRWYIYVCKDVFDGAIYLKWARSRKMEQVLAFLIEAWQQLGLPAQVQFDNARELCGWGRAARYLSRVIRLCLYLHITPIFIPQRRPIVRRRRNTPPLPRGS